MTTLQGGIRTCFYGAGMALFLASPALGQSRACSSSSSDSVLVTPVKWPAPLDRPVVAQPVTVALRDALDRVAALAKVRLSYSAELLPLSRPVCFATNGQPVGHVLATLLAGTNIAAIPVGNDQVVLTPRLQSPAAAPTAVEMAQTTSVLDRVVVTGNSMDAPDRELTVGVNSLSGRRLAREHATTLSAALDGYVPGVWSWPQSPSSALTSYGSIRGASSFGLSYPKIYIDGIEVANPLLVSRFSPEAIDRIEVIRGPQGSALYGMDAISGVINIVTRHEAATAEGGHASLSTSAGLVKSDFARSTLTQNHTASLTTGSATRSADLHVSSSSVGEFIPGGGSRDFLATGSARFIGARSTISTTARYFTQEAGGAASPLIARPAPAMGATGPRRLLQDTLPQSVQQYTLGTTAVFAADDRWTHTATAGIDGYNLANVKSNATPIPSVALQDSALRAAQGSAARGTLRASSVLHLGESDASRTTVTFSAEQGLFRSSSLAPTAGPVTTSPLGQPPMSQTSPRNAVNWQSSTSFTTQANTSLNNTYFLTGGVRFERDSRLAGNQIAALPMLGAAAVRDYGPLTVKLRGSYGQGIRPPSTFGRADLWSGAYAWSAQQELGAEKQVGTEAGIDLMLRRALSLRITRFDQRASGLIQLVVVPGDTNPRTHHVRYDLENLGEISNRGWEFESSANISRLSLSATLSLVKSRVEKVATGYKGDLVAGDRMLLVPARTGSVSASWLGRNWFASVGASRALDWINYDELGLSTDYLSGERPAYDFTGQQLRQYWRRYNGSLRIRASLSRDIRDMFTFEVSGDNLLDYQQNEPDNLTVLPGRTITTGVKVRF